MISSCISETVLAIKIKSYMTIMRNMTSITKINIMAMSRTTKMFTASMTIITMTIIAITITMSMQITLKTLGQPITSMNTSGSIH